MGVPLLRALLFGVHIEAFLQTRACSEHWDTNAQFRIPSGEDLRSPNRLCILPSFLQAGRRCCLRGSRTSAISAKRTIATFAHDPTESRFGCDLWVYSCLRAMVRLVSSHAQLFCGGHQQYYQQSEQQGGGLWYLFVSSSWSIIRLGHSSCTELVGDLFSCLKAVKG